MKAVLLALALLGALVVVAEPASAGCPDPDYPCDPMPYDPLPGQCSWEVSKRILYCLL